MRLDETILRANLAMVTKVLDENAVRQARLKAERDGNDEITFSEALIARYDEPVLHEIMESESKLFATRRQARDGLKAQLRERTRQLQEEVLGQTAQLKARGLEHEYAKAELAGLDQLADAFVRGVAPGEHLA